MIRTLRRTLLLSLIPIALGGLWSLPRPVCACIEPPLPEECTWWFTPAANFSACKITHSTLGDITGLTVNLPYDSAKTTWSAYGIQASGSVSGDLDTLYWYDDPWDCYPDYSWQHAGQGVISGTPQPGSNTVTAYWDDDEQPPFDPPYDDGWDSISTDESGSKSVAVKLIQVNVAAVDYVFLGETAGVSESVNVTGTDPVYAWYRPNDPLRINFLFGGQEVPNILYSDTATILGKTASVSVDDTWVQGTYWFRQVPNGVFVHADTCEPLTVAAPTRLILSDPGNTANKVDTAGGTGNTLYLAEPPSAQTKQMNMTLYWGPCSLPQGSHGNWKIVKMDGSATASWSPASGTFTGSGGSGTASTTWTEGNPAEREFKVRVWCDNVTYNGVCDTDEVVFERLVTVFKVELKASDGVNPPKDYVAVDSSVGYMAKITPEGTDVGFQWTDGNGTGKFTFDNPALQTVTITAGSLPSSAVNAEKATVVVKAPVTGAVISDSTRSQDFTIFRLNMLILQDSNNVANVLTKMRGDPGAATLYLNENTQGTAAMGITVVVNPAGFQTNRFRWQITDSGVTLANVWSPNQGAGLSAFTTWDSTRTPLFRTCLVRSWFDEIQNGTYDSASEAIATLTADVTVVKMRLKSVTFSGEKIHTVQKDDGTGAFPSPHWLDTNMNGTIETGEYKSPVSYTCTIGHWYDDDESYMSTGVEIVTAGLPPSLPNIYIRATDANGKNYEFVGGGTVTSGSPDILAYTAGAAQCPTEILKDTVDYMNPLTLNWEVTWGGSPVWHPVGQSQNTAYITWRDPTPATLYETILLVGCRGANGMTSSDEDDIIAGVWSEFTTSVSDGVERADGVHMGYWLTGDPAQYIHPYGSNPTKLGMLQRSDGDGSCIAWSQLLHWSLEAQGLGTYSQIYNIIPDLSLNPDAGGFLVKDWTFPRHIRTGSDATRESPVLGDDIPVPPSGTNSVCILPGPNWTLDSVTAGTDVYADELFPGASWPHRVDYDAFPGTYPGTRIPAQNNAGSPYWFANHWVCKIKGSVYDPSYGGVPYSTESAHENAAIDGLRDDTAPPDPPYAKKDNDSVQELVYTRDSNKE